MRANTVNGAATELPKAEADALRDLDSFLTQDSEGSLCLANSRGESVQVPASVQSILRTVARELVRGNAISVTSVQTELTTQQAADILGVSRPFLVGLLESGAIPFHRVGTHRRVRRDDVMAFQQARSHERKEALAEIAREAQEMGLYE
jgi:excisionase family DNA binding protein